MANTAVRIDVYSAWAATVSTVAAAPSEDEDAGARNPRLARNVRAPGKRALALLTAALGDDAAKDG